MASKKNPPELLIRKQRKYPLGTDVDKEEIFNYPYLTEEDTVSFLKDYGRVMFIIRGPNSTMKATLSEMLMTKYPTSQHCCADHYFSKTFSSPQRNKETLTAAHKYCQKKVEAACMKNESPIIVQNTHIRKSELQNYLDLAAVYNYTIIMAVTLYKFNVTPKALERINPDGLNLQYFRNRLRQWEDVLPFFTGWFLSPSDSAVVLKSLQKTLSTLLDDGKFCRVFNCYDDDSIWNYFSGRRNLYCIAGYSYDVHNMRTYYFSDEVQGCYGKSYFITIYGYLITQSGVVGIVNIEEEMKHLLLIDNTEAKDNICEKFDSIGLNDNINEYKTNVPLFHENVISEKHVTFVDWIDDFIDLKNCKLIHIAQKKSEPFDLRIIKDSFFKTLNSIDDYVQYTEIENINVCRLPQNEWLIKLPKKIKVRTLFTGLYV